MDSKKDQSRGGSTLAVNLRFLDVRESDSRPGVSVYAFDPHGRLLSRAEVGKGDSAKLEIPKVKGIGSIRVVAGPSLDDENVSASQLSRVGGLAKEIDLRKVPKEIGFEILRLRWTDWFLNFCCVRGRVVKRVGSGSSLQNLPVCDATVEIYEVDPWRLILPTLPKDILDDIRDIVDGPWPPIPLPDPGDPILPELPPIPGPQPDPVPFRRVSSGLSLNRSVQSASLQTSLPTDLKVAAQIGSDDVFKRVLLDYQRLLLPVFCWYPWWKRFVRKTKVCQTTTDCHGDFTCCFIRPWGDPDQPDLWFRVRQTIPGFGDTVIYERYPVGCHTIWNYQCGDPVTLTVTDPRAYTCACGPDVGNDGEWVLLDQIGATVASAIRGMSADLAASTNASNRGLTEGGNPFAGLIQPTMYFSPGLTAAGVKYKVSFKRADQPESAYEALSGPISRSYLFSTGSGAQWGSYPLGPDGDGNYEVRPALPPQGTWEVRYPRADRSAADWDTFGELPAGAFGLYQLKIEMFKSDGTPLAPNDSSLGFEFLLGKEGTTVQEEASSLGLVVGDALVVDLFVDTVGCSASIHAPAIGGSSASPQCGGLNFSDPSQTVTLSYAANQPRGFYTYTFRVVRGQGNVVLNLTNQDSGDPQSHSLSVASMIGPCSGGAAFASTLDVNSTAIDGYSRVSSLDAPLDSFGFMLLQV